MALTSALAKHEVALGVAANAQATSQQQLMQQRILELTEKLTAQQQDLLQAVEGSQAQLASQQAVIDAVLTGQRMEEVSALKQAPKTASHSQVEDAWFVRRHAHSKAGKQEAHAEPRSDADDAQKQRDQKQEQKRRQRRHQKQQVKVMLRQWLDTKPLSPPAPMHALQQHQGSGDQLHRLLQRLRLAAHAKQNDHQEHGRGQAGVRPAAEAVAGDVAKAFDAHVEEQLARYEHITRRFTVFCTCTACEVGYFVCSHAAFSLCHLQI
jgi:hypothetical protein